MNYGAGADFIGPEYRPDLMTTAGDIPTTGMSEVPYGPEYNPTLLFLDTYKWWLIGGGAAVFVLAGGSILGLSLRNKRRGRR